MHPDERNVEREVVGQVDYNAREACPRLLWCCFRPVPFLYLNSKLIRVHCDRVKMLLLGAPPVVPKEASPEEELQASRLILCACSILLPLLCCERMPAEPKLAAVYVTAVCVRDSFV